MRLYAVITPPPAVLHHLRSAVDEARTHTPEVPWTEPSMWSLMLARFGNLGLDETTVVRETLGAIGTYCPPLSLQLTGAVATPEDSLEVESLGVGMTGDLAELWSLATAVPAMVQRHGMFLDRRSFQAVIPLAQAAQGLFPPARALAALQTYQGPTWTSTEMRLVRLIPRSDDQPGLGEYEDIERFSFTAEPEPAPEPDAESGAESGAESRAESYATTHRAP